MLLLNQSLWCRERSSFVLLLLFIISKSNRKALRFKSKRIVEELYIIALYYYLHRFFAFAKGNVIENSFGVLLAFLNEEIDFEISLEK